MKFSKHDISGTKIEMEIPDDSSLDEVLEEFQNFLRACSYTIEYNQCLVFTYLGVPYEENMED